VTVASLQMTRHLLAPTGEARYAEEPDQTVLNHLSAAQRPGGPGWAYYTPLQGNRVVGGGISCCISSGPRGMALVPLWSPEDRAEYDGGALETGRTSSCSRGG
jgi:DUF1680 family protein